MNYRFIVLGVLAVTTGLLSGLYTNVSIITQSTTSPQHSFQPIPASEQDREMPSNGPTSIVYESSDQRIPGKADVSKSDVVLSSPIASLPPPASSPSSMVELLKRVQTSRSPSNKAVQSQFSTIVVEAQSAASAATFEASTYLDTQPCGAIVNNFCMDAKGQPTFFHPTKLMMNSKGSTTMCNEGNKKSRLHHRVASQSAKSSRHEAFQSIVSTSNSTTSSTYIPQVFIAPYCWELYGYHLMLCLMSMFAHLDRIGFGTAVMVDSEITLGMVKSAGVFPYLAGSTSSWYDFSREDMNLASKPQPTPYWPFWQVLADKPNQVHPVSEIKNKCFDVGIFGSIPSYLVTPEEGRAFRLWSLSRLKVPVRMLRKNEVHKNFEMVVVENEKLTSTTKLVSCKQYRIVLLQRSKRYKITNLPDLESQIRRGFDGVIYSFKTVVLENMTLAEQMEEIANTDIIIGVHGNGLTWSYLMPPQAGIIELWPNRVYNQNYKKFAIRHNLFYATVTSGADCKARCPASYTIPSETFVSVTSHFDATACRGKTFDTSPIFHEQRPATKLPPRG